MFVADRDEAHDGKPQAEDFAGRAARAHAEPHGQTYEPVCADAFQQYDVPRHGYFGQSDVPDRFVPRLRGRDSGQVDEKVGEQQRAGEIAEIDERPVACDGFPRIPAAERSRNQDGVVAREQLRSGQNDQNQPERKHGAREQLLQTRIAGGRLCEAVADEQRQRAAHGDVGSGQRGQYERFARSELRFGQGGLFGGGQCFGRRQGFLHDWVAIGIYVPGPMPVMQK